MSRPEVTIQTNICADKPKTKKTPGVPRGFRLPSNCEPAPVYCPEVSKEYIEEIMRIKRISKRNNENPPNFEPAPSPVCCPEVSKEYMEEIMRITRRNNKSK